MWSLSPYNMNDIFRNWKIQKRITKYNWRAWKTRFSWIVTSLHEVQTYAHHQIHVLAWCPMEVKCILKWKCIIRTKVGKNIWGLKYLKSKIKKRILSGSNLADIIYKISKLSLNSHEALFTKGEADVCSQWVCGKDSS